MKTTIVGYPRIGENRELKFAIENYWKGAVSKMILNSTTVELRKTHWLKQKESGITYPTSNEFSYYDRMLDTAVMLNVIPKKYCSLELDFLDTYFAMARGYQGEKGDVTALAMKKWFNTNYHYIVPELEDDTCIHLNPKKLFAEYDEAITLGIQTRPVTIGPYTFLKLAVVTGTTEKKEYISRMIEAYCELVEQCCDHGIAWLQLDEPALVMDQTLEELLVFRQMYQEILAHKGNTKVLLQTYYGDVRDSYEMLMDLPFDGVGLDFIEGRQTLSLIEQYGIPKDKTLFAGVVNGKNIWRCDYKKTLQLLTKLKKVTDKIVISTSCSLQHVPYTITSEKGVSENVKKFFSFAEERLVELYELAQLMQEPLYERTILYQKNQEALQSTRSMLDESVRTRVNQLQDYDFIRKGKRKERQKLQKSVIELPLLPTTTIGSFPQTDEVKKNRSNYRKGKITKEEYDNKNYEFIKICIALQEELDLDVLVHGEYERNDMVEFFGENLAGYVFTQNAWVQSYGTRCVKPPIIFGDIKRIQPITVSYSQYAQSLTTKPVKGMLTGPITILNWSFPREDITLREMALQIAVAIRGEVLDLESAGIKIIQIDEAAFREKLPLRKEDWYSEYLDWALQAFRLCHSGVQEETQIHTHMCYSEFDDIIKEIDALDADVITFEASRSKLSILDVLEDAGFEAEVGPGVYDIHSPRIPSVEEIVRIIHAMLRKLPKENLWINPDCGLKTRGMEETKQSLHHLVEATKIIRNEWL